MISRRRPVMGLVCAMAMATVCVSVAASPSDASSCGVSGHWHNMFYTPPSSSTEYDGVHVVADAESATFCSGGDNTNFTNFYDMTYSQSGADWSQIGYERGSANGSNPGLHEFAQINNGSREDTWYSGSTVTAGTRHDYKVITTSPSLTGDYLDGNLKLSGSTTAWSTPFRIQIAEEAEYVNDDVPGTQSQHVQATQIRYQNSNGAFVDTPSGIFDGDHANATKWHTFSVDATDKDFYTDPTN